MPSLEEYSDYRSETDDLRAANARLQKQLRDAKNKVQLLVDATHQGAYDAMVSLGKVPSVRAPKTVSKKGQEEVALWHITDTQVGKETPDYNTEIAKERVIKFVDKAIKITDMQRTSHPVNQCVIAFGGDMIEGACFQFPSQPFEIDSTIFEQYVNTSRILVDVVRKALSAYDKVTVVAEYGNHGRMGSKRDCLPKSDNIDRMVYHLSKEILGNQDRLIWEDDEEDIKRIEVGNYRALLIHGDEIGRGGFASPSTIVRHADRWKSGAYPWDFRDIYTGHYHCHLELPMANGEGAVFQTGSTESSNRYARDTMAASAIPSQRLHFIDPIRGRVTSQYRILLDE